MTNDMFDQIVIILCKLSGSDINETHWLTWLQFSFDQRSTNQLVN